MIRGGYPLGRECTRWGLCEGGNSHLPEYLSKKAHMKNDPSIGLEKLLHRMKDSNTYDHLKIILSKNNYRNIGQRYLMVTRDGFGIVRLLDVDYSNQGVVMELEDVETGLVKKVTLNVEDRGFKLVLISWGDVLDMLEDTIMARLIVGG